MESTDKTNYAKTLKTKRFEIQKNIHLFMREMMRYFDIYLLAGAITIKGFVFGLLQYTTSTPPIILSILFVLEFFFLFTRIALEYHRKKNQQTIFVEVSNNRAKYTTGVYVGIAIAVIYTETSWLGFGFALFLNALYYYSNILLASAAVSIHTKDAQFTEKYVGMKKTIVLAEKKEPQIIAVKTTENQRPKAQETTAGPNEEETKLKKKFDNLLYRLRVAENNGDKTKSTEIKNNILEIIDNNEIDYPELCGKVFDKLEAAEQ